MSQTTENLVHIPVEGVELGGPSRFRTEREPGSLHPREWVESKEPAQQLRGEGALEEVADVAADWFAEARQ